MIFRNPIFLSFFILILPIFMVLIWKRKLPLSLPQKPAIDSVHFSDISAFQNIKSSWKVRLASLMPWLTIGAVLLIILALARPQIGLKQSLVRKAGIDIVMVLDVSPSMLAEDFKFKGKQTNRLEVVKNVAKNFIEKRPDDRIGIVIFAGQPYILAPLTWDHDWCLSRLNEVQVGIVDEGTAIGSALATAVNRLKDSKAKSKVIILLTDGVNNAGEVMPEAAAKAAKTMSIAVYTIGAGSKGLVPFPTIDPSGTKSYQNLSIDLDENLLTQVAKTTGGRYFLATDSEGLAAIFERINKMERSFLNMPQYQEYQDLYPYLLGLAFMLLLIETLLSNTILRRIP